MNCGRLGTDAWTQKCVIFHHHKFREAQAYKNNTQTGTGERERERECYTACGSSCHRDVCHTGYMAASISSLLYELLKPLL